MVRANADRLRRLREDRGLSQRELAALAGVSPNTIFKLEKNRAKSPHPRTLRKLAGVLGVEPGELIERD